MSRSNTDPVESLWCPPSAQCYASLARFASFVGDQGVALVFHTEWAFHVFEALAMCQALSTVGTSSWASPISLRRQLRGRNGQAGGGF